MNPRHPSSKIGSEQEMDHESAYEVAERGRLGVMKTYKLYVGGKFPRTESGRYFKLTSSDGHVLANMCQASRKDFREAVVAARAAQSGWAKASAYLRGQIVYRIAEMLEGRSSQFVSELVQQGADPSEAQAEIAGAVDRLVYYAGWSDKYQQVFSSVNPVATSHFNFSMLEPTGVVGVMAPDGGTASSLLGLISVVMPAVVGGNAVVVLASRAKPLCAVSFAEVLHTSDLPGGVVNVLTGDRDELVEHFGSHMDVNACVCSVNGEGDKELLVKLRTVAAGNIKRVIGYERSDWLAAGAHSPYMILDTQEIKTTWHPVGQ